VLAVVVVVVRVIQGRRST
jgi:hypothetical protein